MLAEKRRRQITLAGLTLLLAVGLTPPRSARAISIFSSGQSVPESISQVPSGFGNLGGNYLIPDPVAHNIWEVPQAGGAPTAFASDPNSALRGGLFLPSGWGANTGMYLAVGDTAMNTTSPLGTVSLYDASANVTQLTTSTTQLTSTAIAPAGYGSFGGQAFITGQTGVVEALNQSMQISLFATLSTDFSFRPFGIAFAPAGWGTVGGEMLVSNGVDTRIDAVDSSGNAMLFTTISGVTPGFGLRQMAFAPPGFLPGFGTLLLVSVAGSDFGGGTLGDVLALDPSGNVVASLRSNLGLAKFDPRGLLFRTDGSLLISDASDAVLLATRSDFQAVPEPGSLVLLACGLAGVTVAWARQRFVLRAGR
jgi:hypothetical protein